VETGGYEAGSEERLSSIFEVLSYMKQQNLLMIFNIKKLNYIKN